MTNCTSQVSRHLETRRLRFQNGFNLLKNASGEPPPDSHNEVVEQPVVEPREKTLDQMMVSSEEESTDLPASAERSKRPITCRHKVFTRCPEDPKCKVCELTRTARAPCRNRPDTRGNRTHLPQIFDNTSTTNHKDLNEENEYFLRHSY